MQEIGAFFVGKIPDQNPIKRVQAVVSDCSRFATATMYNQITLHPSSPTDISPPRFSAVMQPTATRVFLPLTKGGRGERAWERACLKVCSHFCIQLSTLLPHFNPILPLSRQSDYRYLR